MRNWMVVLLTLTAASAPRPGLPARIEAAWHRTKALDPAFVGIQVIDLRTGKVVYEHNADHLFIPASNTKLFTTALALRTLGPDYRFATTVVATRSPDTSGR